MQKIKTKALIPLVSFASCLSLFGIGYGSWSLGTYAEFNEMEFHIGHIIDLPSYVKNFNIETFKIGPNGIIDKETIVYNGTISIQFDLMIKNGLLNDFNPQSNAVMLYFKIENVGTFNFFSSDFLVQTKGVDFSINDGVQSRTGSENIEIGTDYSTFTINHTCANLNDINHFNYDIDIKFNFESYKSDFENEIYNNLGDNPLNFRFNMEVVNNEKK